MNHLKWTLGLMVLSVAAGGAQSPSPAPTRNVLTPALWDDGRAEFCLYTGTTQRYGQPRPTEARIIVVKEDVLRATLVKSEAGPLPGKTVEAIKLNFLADFPTGSYAYHQMATVHFDRATMEVLKETMSHTESCGMTFVRVGPKHGKTTHETHSYWEGEADREVAIRWSAGERLYWDALPVSLRRWMTGKTPFDRKVWILPSQISGHSPIENTRPVEARLRMSAGGTIDVPAGRFAARKFEITTPDGTDVFWFDESFPHVLLKLETHAGRSLALRKAQRLDYWKHHANGDEKYLL